jgi:hypothetical protein
MSASGKSRAYWATLYCGLTKVIDLHYLESRGFRLDVHPAWKNQHWNPSWSKYRDGFPWDEWTAVEAYLERAIPPFGPRHLREGSVQSAVSAFQTQPDALARP